MHAKNFASFICFLLYSISTSWASSLIAVLSIGWIFLLKLIMRRNNMLINGILAIFGGKGLPDNSLLAMSVAWCIFERVSTSVIYWTRPIFEANLTINMEHLLFRNRIYMDFGQFFRRTPAVNCARLQRHSKAIEKSAGLLVFDLIGSMVSLFTGMSYLSVTLETAMTLKIVVFFAAMSYLRIVLFNRLRSIKKECISIDEKRSEKLTECFENFIILSTTGTDESQRLKSLFGSLPKLKYSMLSDLLKMKSKILATLLCLYVVFESTVPPCGLIQVINELISASNSLNQLVSSFFKLEAHRIDLEDLENIDFADQEAQHMSSEVLAPAEDEEPTLLRLDDVSIFAQDVLVLRNVTLDIKYDEKIALVGRNGSGKTTFLRFLLGFHRQIGSVQIRNVHVANIGKSMLPLVSYIPQNTYLNETVQDELRQSTISSRDVVRIAKQVGIHEAIKARRSGYDTHVTELSESEVQLVKIVKGCSKQAPLLLADEPLCSLSGESHDRILDVMLQSPIHATKLIIIHQKSQIDKFDKIFHFEDGTIKTLTVEEYKGI